MTANKDVYNFGAIQKKENYESITPHKISILLYIQEFCMLKLKGTVRNSIIYYKPVEKIKFNSVTHGYDCSN